MAHEELGGSQYVALSGDGQVTNWPARLSTVSMRPDGAIEPVQRMREAHDDQRERGRRALRSSIDLRSDLNHTRPRLDNRYPIIIGEVLRPHAMPWSHWGHAAVETGVID